MTELQVCMEFMLNTKAIILNNDQHQHQKIISTNNSINSKIKQQHTTLVNWCFCLREVLFQCVVCCVQVCLAWKTISCQTCKGNRLYSSAQHKSEKETMPMFVENYLWKDWTQPIHQVYQWKKYSLDIPSSCTMSTSNIPARCWATATGAFNK